MHSHLVLPNKQRNRMSEHFLFQLDLGVLLVEHSQVHDQVEK